MEDSILEFAEEASSDGKEAKKYEKAEDIHYGFIVLFIFALGICWYYESNFTSITEGYIPYNDYSFLFIPAIILMISFIGWRAKRNTNMTQGDVALYYLGQSILKYDNNDYNAATELLEKFKIRATKSSTDIFTDSTKSQIDEYVHQYEDESRNEKLFEETFVDFVETIIDKADTDSKLEELIEDSGEKDIEQASAAEVFSEGLGGFPVDRYVVLQLVTVVVALYVFYNLNEQLGMFLVVSVLPILQYIKNTQN